MDRVYFHTTYQIFLLIAGALVVTSNLIFKKFTSLTFFGWVTVDVSAGIFSYPFLFLITDVVSECYGRKAAQKLVALSLLGAFIMSGYIWFVTVLPTSPISLLSDEQFKDAFDIVGLATLASILAYGFSQLMDLHIFLHLKRLMAGRFLWGRSLVSSVLSIVADTVLVLGLLYGFGCYEEKICFDLLWGSLLFKIIVVALTSPLIAVIVSFVRNPKWWEGTVRLSHSQKQFKHMCSEAFSS